MHLIESFSTEFRMVPVIHEVAAVIATDYFNEYNSNLDSKAFALVTVGPGITNTITGIASSFVDSRELLVIAGQVKSTDLKLTSERSFGVQEIDGISLVKPVTKFARRIKSPIRERDFLNAISSSWLGRKGPVVLEICLDIQGAEVDKLNYEFQENSTNLVADNEVIRRAIIRFHEVLRDANRPLLLIGGGVSRRFTKDLDTFAQEHMLPVATTWNGADRVHSNHDFYAGRSNLYGQRWSNIIIQQADLILAMGTSLGLQQTGFNRKEFAPLAKIVHFDLESSLETRDNSFDLETIKTDLNLFLPELFRSDLTNQPSPMKIEWISFIRRIREMYPVIEKQTFLPNKINPFKFIYELSKKSNEKIAVVSCSSGGTYTSLMQTFQNQKDQVLLSSRGLGSMGFGLAGAIGVAMASAKIVWLFDGDGGFAQNYQELGTVVANSLPIKIIIFSNNGYGSIRSTQKKYFKRNYIGCDPLTGVVLPKLEVLAKSYGIIYNLVENLFDYNNLDIGMFFDQKTRIIEVKISSEQQYLPKINSTLKENGEMESNPLHLMFPEISETDLTYTFKYFAENEFSNFLRESSNE